MKKLFAVLTLVLLVSSISFAQVNKGWDGTKPEVVKGAKSFVFMYSPFVSANLNGVNSGMYGAFQDSLNTTPMNYGGVGFQYYLSNNWSLGGGLFFGINSSKTTDLTYSLPETTAVLYERKVSGFGFGVNVDLNHHFTSLYSISPYFGINANIGSNNYTIQVTRGTAIDKYEWSGMAIGLGLNLGFDWYFTPGMSLGGKYTLGASIGSAPTQTHTPSTGPAVIVSGPSDFNIGTGVASIMLNVHF